MRSRGYCLGQATRDYYRAISYSPPPVAPVCGDEWATRTHTLKHSNGVAHWWTCSCGASGVCADEATAARDLAAHLVKP